MGLAKISPSQCGIVWSLRVHKQQNARTFIKIFSASHRIEHAYLQHHKCLNICVINAHLAIFSSSVEICRVGRRPFGNLVLSKKGHLNFQLLFFRGRCIVTWDERLCYVQSLANLSWPAELTGTKYSYNPTLEQSNSYHISLALQDLNENFLVTYSKEKTIHSF